MKSKSREQEDSNSRHVGENVIDLFFSPAEITEERLRAYKITIVIDVLRTSTTIVSALANGAKGVIPVSSISAATSLAAQLARDDVLLCGERDGKLIDGFHLGNSPSDYSRERVRGKTLIIGSTNGTPALTKAAGTGVLMLCGFINLPNVVEAILNETEKYPLAILCSGKLNRFAIEDAVCGGVLVEALLKRLEGEPVLNDAARTSRLIARENGTDFLSLLYNSDHGKYLISIGMEGDLAHCAASGIFPVVPILKDGKLVKWEK